jgi:hypothetical protein
MAGFSNKAMTVIFFYLISCGYQNCKITFNYFKEVNVVLKYMDFISVSGGPRTTTLVTFPLKSGPAEDNYKSK